MCVCVERDTERKRQCVCVYREKEREREGFPGGSDGKESTCNTGALGSSLGREDPL